MITTKCTGAVLAGLVRFAVNVESRPGDFERYPATRMLNWDEYDDMGDLARAMWNHVGSQQDLGLPPDRLRALFARVYDNCRNISALWQLGGATNDYLRINPDSLTVPADLPTTLLKSDDVEARVIGLKLLNRCDHGDERVIVEIIRAMERRDRYESYGGFHECAEFLERRRARGVKIDGELVQRLQQVLATFGDDEDDYSRSTARRLSEKLAAF